MGSRTMRDLARVMLGGVAGGADKAGDIYKSERAARARKLEAESMAQLKNKYAKEAALDPEIAQFNLGEKRKGLELGLEFSGKEKTQTLDMNKKAALDPEVLDFEITKDKKIKENTAEVNKEVLLDQEVADFKL